jgi:hypothetical protein
MWSAGGALGLALASRTVAGKSSEGTAPMQRPRALWAIVRRFFAYTVGLPVLAFLLLVGLTLGGLFARGVLEERAEPEVHLIPAGYMGNVYIIHNVSGAPAPEFEQRSRVYRIGVDGVHLTQLDQNTGIHQAGEVRYYYVGPDGTRVPIAEQWHSTIPDTPENRADQTTVGIYSVIAGSVLQTNPKCEFSFTSYYVGTNAHLLSMNSRNVNEGAPSAPSGVCQ